MIYTAFAVPSKTNGMKSLELRDEANLDYPLRHLDNVWAGSPTDSISEAVIEDLGRKPVGNFVEGRVLKLGKGLNWGQSALEDAWKEQARSMIYNGIKVTKDLHKIVELEKQLRWTFEGRRFIGYADVIAEDKEGKLEFYDFKTSWNKPGKRLQEDFQFYAYSYALKKIYNLDYFPKGYFVHLKSGDALPFEVTTENSEHSHEQAQRVFELMEFDVFPKLGPHVLCGYCDFQKHCFGDTRPWEGDDVSSRW